VQAVEIPELHCYRCGNTWTPRVQVVRICPRCKSPYWDEPKIHVPSRGNGQGIAQVLGPHLAGIERIARRYHVREIRVFGSLARNAATPKSDIDLLVDFDRSKAAKSKLRALDLAQDLEALLDRRVHVATEESLHWFIQPQVVTEAVPI
jgi:uncharacterized protein